MYRCRTKIQLSNGSICEIGLGEIKRKNLYISENLGLKIKLINSRYSFNNNSDIDSSYGKEENKETGKEEKGRFCEK